MKKAFTILLVAGMLTAPLTGMAKAAPLDESGTPGPQPYYLSVTGTINSIEEFEAIEDAFRINIEDTHGNPAYLIVTDKTVFPFGTELNEGDIVTGYYLANAPMILIWPPQYNIAVLVAGKPADININVDRFHPMQDHTEDYLLSQGEMFAFRVDDETEIILANGDDFSDGDIIGRRLVVIYGISTRSIPELATAIKVIVLFEDPVTGPEPLPESFPGINNDETLDASGWPILVDGEQIEAPAAIQNEDGILLVPIRAIAEALRYDVNWDHNLRSVRLGVAIHLWIGNTEVHSGRMAPIHIPVAPQLINGSTYVPLSFFRDVLGVASAFAFEGQIEINSEGEPME